MKTLDLESIFPRLYAILPRVGKAEVTLSSEHSQVESKFAGDLMILYGRDTGSTYEMVSQGQIKALGLSKEELHEIAVENLSTTTKEIRLHDGTDFYFVTCDGDLEASLVLHEGIWEVVADKIGGDILASVPARNTLLISGTQKIQISALKKKTCECLEMAHRPLSLKLFRRTFSGWEEYSA